MILFSKTWGAFYNFAAVYDADTENLLQFIPYLSVVT